ncbi:hypothetical protein [Membranihabitans marinus]|uniref:hypothetical protein n=1 Tax=Membranihabitans marinus TaxID=1227546 RepID=UPI001F335A5D|nr:hypothetical protein [Membranihabitans marinus]
MVAAPSSWQTHPEHGGSGSLTEGRFTTFGASHFARSYLVYLVTLSSPTQCTEALAPSSNPHLLDWVVLRTTSFSHIQSFFYGAEHFSHSPYAIRLRPKRTSFI